MLPHIAFERRPSVNKLPQALRVLLISLFCLIAIASTAQQIPDSMYQDMRWRLIGPFRGGRTRPVAGVPSQPNVFYMAPVDGGVWKSDDYGRTWQPIFDSQPTGSIGDIAVAPSDPNIIYVASGEALHRPDLSVGNGIYKSTDAGKTWTYLNALSDGQQIPQLAIDPRDPNKVFAAVLGHPYGPNDERGIFRTTDGGRDWTKVLYKDVNTGGDDVEIDPSNPSIVYATLWEAREGPWEDGNEYGGTKGGVFKSIDGGTTWKQLKNGLPDNLVQANIAIARSEPSRLYMTFSTTERSEYATNKGMGFYRSDDGGEHWYKASDDPRSAMKIGGGDLAVPVVDPKNPDIVYSCGIVASRSTNSGKTFTSWRGAPGGDDYQNLWINPNNPNIILLVADQGAIVTVNGGQTWSSWYNQPTAQMYHAITTNEWPYKVCGGQQESGSACVLSRGNDGYITFRDWHPVNVIEYGYVAPDPLDPNIIYGAGRNEVSKYDWRTGQTQNVTPIPVRDGYRTERTEPVIFSPVDPHIMYYASNVLFKTSDGGKNWQTISPDLSNPDPGLPPSVDGMAATDKRATKHRGAIYSVAPSFKNINTIWAGSDDGKLWITRDGGKNWKDITPPQLTGWSKVTMIEASHFDDNTAYASVSRFRIDDLKPYIYRTHDGGQTWQLIVNGLGNFPVNTVREDPVRKSLLFTGSEASVSVSFDDGDHWQPLQLNLPHTSMRDLWIHDNDLIVATHGRSFWILDDISPLRQAKATTSDVLFNPDTAIRVPFSTYAETPLPPDEPMGQNPPDGAIIDYYLAQPASGVVTIDILDSGGRIIRKFASDDKPELTPEELSKQLIPIYWVRMPQNPATTAGMHRFVWDLHYPSPTSVTHEYPITAVPENTPRYPLGPHAVPGRYTVRLTVNGKSYTAPLIVKLDPRVKTSQADLEQMFAAEQKLALAVSRSSEAVLQAKSVQEQIKNLKPASSLADALKGFDSKVSAALNGPENPPADAPKPSSLSSVNETAYSLYKMVGQVDAAPTPAQLADTSNLDRDLPTVMNQWNQIVKTDLPAINTQLKQAGLPEINPRQKPENGENQGNEE
jgi:photosystem II stability/assembly factor-like uncharacterized protein